MRLCRIVLVCCTLVFAVSNDGAAQPRPGAPGATNRDNVRMREMFEWAWAQTSLCTSIMRYATYGVVRVSVPDVPAPAIVQRLCTSPRGQLQKAKVARMIAIERGEHNSNSGWNALAYELVHSIWAPHSPGEADFVRRNGAVVAQTLDDYLLPPLPRNARQTLEIWTRYVLTTSTGCG